MRDEEVLLADLFSVRAGVLIHPRLSAAAAWAVTRGAPARSAFPWMAPIQEEEEDSLALALPVTLCLRGKRPRAGHICIAGSFVPQPQILVYKRKKLPNSVVLKC